MYVVFKQIQIKFIIIYYNCFSSSGRHEEKQQHHTVQVNYLQAVIKQALSVMFSCA